MINEMNLEVEELIEKNASDFQISKVFKKYIQGYVNSIDTSIDTNGGKDFFVQHTKVTDKFLISLYKYILRKNFGSYQPMSTSIPISIIALGSYGREQLCIYSDIDLLLLYEDVKGYNIKNIIQEFITLAWDCGLKLGSRVHELNDVAESVKEDITIKTAIIESRLIYGSKYLWFGYENVLSRIRKTDQLQFILEKKQEHMDRLLKYPLKMEPNIKDGYGGMREANMVFWIANVVFGVTRLRHLMDKEFTEEEYKKYRISLEYIFQVRNHLHNIAKKKLDTVNFDILPELSTKLGFKHTPRKTKETQAMNKIFESLHNIHFFTNILTKKFTRALEFKNQNYDLVRENRFKKNLFIYEGKIYTSYFNKPKTLTAFLKELISLPISVERFDQSYVYYASKTILPQKQTKEHKLLLRRLLYKESLYPIIKLLYNARIFESIFPITKKIINQPQFDGYHELPVDVHSIKTLKHLSNIKDEFVKELYESFDKTEQSIIKIATFFHDVGKGRITDHHIAGEKLFRNMARGLSFKAEHTQVIAKLIRYHNMMSKVATSEDIYSEKVIRNFSGLVQNKKFLDMLFVLTYGDISAVGKNIYKSSTSTLLRELYHQTLYAFENTTLLTESSRRIAKINSIKKLKQYNDLPQILKKKITYIASNQIFLQLKAADILDLVLKAKEVETYTYKILNEKALTIRIIRKIPLNLGYLLGKLEFLDISVMNIFKLFDDKKCFEIQFTEKVDDGDLLHIEEIINASFDMSKKLTLKQPVILKNEVEVNCNHTSYLASMRINAINQKGLLAYITKIFDDFGVEIESAKLSLNKKRVRDLFLIEKNGNFSVNSEKIVEMICSND
ncbi:HD domain-containing protein [Arcobacter sp. KX21116]|uniref:[protein-PII] uridylyltransferase family protein n=1 Tax=Arcobacter iocasae TaxID=2906515 RepID=UPI0035D4FA3D